MAFLRGNDVSGPNDRPVTGYRPRPAAASALNESSRVSQVTMDPPGIRRVSNQLVQSVGK